MIGTKQIDIFIICLLVALFLGVWCDRTLYWYLKRKDLPKTVIITMMITVVFLFFYGFTFSALRCILLCQVLLVAGVCDRATYEIPNGLHILIAIVGLIHFQLFPALCGFFLVPLPFLIAALKTVKIGGGDVKLMAVSGFALGVTKGIDMMIWGLLIGFLWNAVFHKKNKRIPLAPFLAFGCFIVLLPI